MILRIALFAMMALGLGGFATVAWVALRPAPDIPAAPMADATIIAPPVRHVVLAAAQPLRAGTLLKPEDLAPKDIDALPLGSQMDTVSIRAALMGGMLRRSLSPGEILLAPDVMRTSDHGFLAAVLAPGRRAASVAVDAVSGSAGLIWPGDHVDLILTQTLEDATLPAAHKVAAETVLADVRVIAIDQLLAHGIAPASDQAGLARTVTLEVTGADAERIAVATRLGKLSLSVRAADDGVADSHLRVLTTWGGDVSPALGSPAPPAVAGTILRLFQGNADGKEFRF